MSFINYETHHIVATVVWYGPVLSGKTTTLQQVFERTHAPGLQTVQLDAQAAEGSTSYEFLPFDLGKIRDFGITLRLFTTPGAAQCSVERRALLEHVDGLMLVADARPHRQQDNRTSLGELQDHLAAWGYALEKMPLVVQCTFTDAPDALPAAEVAAALLAGHPNAAAIPVVASVPPQGTGVFEALKHLSKLILSEMRKS